ncbi:hypothetical protein ACHAPT_002256 [Fusarium lateritium]
MRLLNTKKVCIAEVHGVNIPAYSILSHTWSDEEIILQDVQSSSAYGSPWPDVTEQSFYSQGVSKKKAFSKILQSVNLAARDGYQSIWIDTCCIDKTSSAELSEAINSMYQWYAKADICYAYLADVAPARAEDPSATRSSFRQSRWFTRGWTLQELIASRQVEFFASDWSYLGSKNGDLEFTRLLNQITGIQLDVLTGQLSPQEVSLASRMHWAAHRQTTRMEDIAYCLLGIFDVNMPLLYGEGKRSFIRLQEAILSKEDDQSLFAWHSEPLAVNEGDQTWQMDSSSGFSGLLADSPASFWDNSEIELTAPLTLTSSPPTVTSKGLGVDFLLLPCQDDHIGDEADFRVLLDCERTKDGQRESPVIYLKRIWGLGDQFARVRPDLKTFVSPNIQLFEEAAHERVFVKQDPSSDIKTIRVISASTDSLQLGTHLAHGQLTSDWKIKDAWPRQGWDEQSQTFQTRKLTFGLPCGILRLEVNVGGHMDTLDVAIGMHAPSGRLCRSWCQIMMCDASSAPESAFRWAIGEAESGNITYNELSTQDMHGRGTSTWVVVTERNRRRGVDIMLHVLSPKDRQETESDPKVQKSYYGQIIPVSTLSSEELESLDFNRLLPPSQHHLDSHPERIWQTYCAEVASAMTELTVVDSIETSVFPRMALGSRVRTRSPSVSGVSLESIKTYCLEALPTGDKQMRLAVQFLLGDGGSPNLDCIDALEILEGKTDSFLQLLPIHWAVIGANVAVLQTLLRTGVDTSGHSIGRTTAVHLSMLCDTVAAFHLLTELRVISEALTCAPTVMNGDFPVHFAAAYATQSEFWQFFRSKAVWSHQQNHLGETPLHRACAMANYVAVDNLISLRASVNCVDNHGRTPLWHAACSDYEGSITEALLWAGANASLSDLDGLAPVHVSCRQGTIGCLKQLRSAGADLSFPTGALGLLPAHFAATFGHKRCMQVLLRAGANLLTDAEDGVVVNALHVAIASGQDGCARAIWNSMHAKPEFRGWSPCIVLESLGPVLKWMHVEVNDQYWFAIDDPLKEGGTRGFLRQNPENKAPKLWVDPWVGILSQPYTGETDDEPDEGDDQYYSTDNHHVHRGQRQGALLNGGDYNEEYVLQGTQSVVLMEHRSGLPGDDSYATAAEAQERRGLKHASHRIRSLFSKSG